VLAQHGVSYPAGLVGCRQDLCVGLLLAWATFIFGSAAEAGFKDTRLSPELEQDGAGDDSYADDGMGVLQADYDHDGWSASSPSSAETRMERVHRVGLVRRPLRPFRRPF
jgi:hypothetical protein